MPKILIFKNIWIFIFYGTDVYENRCHVHVGKKDTFELCKIWLEPKIEIANKGELTLKEQRTVLEIAEKYQNEIKSQWTNFKKGKETKVIKIN